MKASVVVRWLLVVCCLLIAVVAVTDFVRAEVQLDSFSSMNNLLVSDEEIESANHDGAINLYAHLDNAILGEGVQSADQELLVFDESVSEKAIGSTLQVPSSQKKTYSKKTNSRKPKTGKKFKKSTGKKNKRATGKKTRHVKSSVQTLKSSDGKSLPPRVAHAIKLTTKKWNKIKKIFSINAVGGPSFHPFKDEMIYVSNEAGVFQLYRIKIDREKKTTVGKAVRLVHTNFRCSAPRYLHDGSILYYHDRGGNENFQIGLITPDSKHYWITKDLKAKHLINRITKNYLYYQSNARDKKVFDLFRRSLPLFSKNGQPSKSERVYTPETGIARVSLVSSDETQLVIEQRYSNVHTELFLKDLVDGTLTSLTRPLAGNAKLMFIPLRFLDHGHTKLLVKTDYKFDHLRLAVLDFEGDIKSNQAKFVTIPQMEALQHDIIGVFGNARTRWTYLEMNQNGYSKLYKTKINVDGGMTKLKPVPLPLENGVVVHGDARSFGHSSALTKDGNLLAITMTDATHPVNIYMVDLDPYNVRFNKKQKALKKLATQQQKKKNAGSTTTTLVPKAQFRHIAMYWTLLPDRLPKQIKPLEKKFVSEQLISISSFDGLMIPYFIYKPKGDVPSDGYPAVIRLHGGPESQSRPVFDPLNQFLVMSGFVVVVPNVRGSKGYGKKYMDADNVEKRMNAVKDVAAVAAFLQKNKDINPNKLVLSGGSYGGYLTNLCMTQIPQYFKAGISVVGMTNLLTFYKNTAEFRRKMRYEEYGNYDTQKDFLKSISPITYIENVKAPMFIIQGKNDERVPAEEAENWYKKLIQESKNPGKTQLKDSKLELFPDEGHGLSKRANRLKAYHDLVNWLNYVLYQSEPVKKTVVSSKSAKKNSK